jgi:2-dehydro-3-deoxyphosphogluconate aldolase / (4S)-4-hydroxy-2-oxoglutarate aldolase
MAQPPDVPAALGRARLVPVVVLDDATHAGPLADALVAGGLPVAEVTFRTPAAGDATGRWPTGGISAWAPAPS